MKLFHVMLCVFSFVSCIGQKKDTTFSFGAFSLRAPVSWKKMSLQGIDSRVGGLTNGIDTLTFDYGMWSYKPKRKDDDCKISYRLQSGRIARYAKQRQNGKGLTAIYIRRGWHKKLCFEGSNLKNEKEALKIMRSIHFTKK